MLPVHLNNSTDRQLICGTYQVITHIRAFLSNYNNFMMSRFSNTILFSISDFKADLAKVVVQEAQKAQYRNNYNLQHWLNLNAYLRNTNSSFQVQIHH